MSGSRFLLLFVFVGATGCGPKPLALTCTPENTTATYDLTLPSGTKITGDLGCKAGVQLRSKEKSRRRLMLLLDSGSASQADTGAGGPDQLDTADSGLPHGGVALGIAWSKWERAFEGMLDVDPWDFTLPRNETQLQGTAEAFAANPEMRDTAVLVAYYDDGTERIYRSEDSGEIRAARYRYIKKTEETTHLQLVIDDLVLENDAVLSLQADLEISGTPLEE